MVPSTTESDDQYLEDIATTLAATVHQENDFMSTMEKVFSVLNNDRVTVPEKEVEPMIKEEQTEGDLLITVRTIKIK